MRRNRLAMIMGASALTLWLAGCAVTSAPPSPASATGAASITSPKFAQALKLMRSHQYADAVPLLEALREENPASSVVVLNLAIAHARCNHDEVAISLLRQALAQQPDSAVAWNEIGMLQRRAGHFVEARQAYERALTAQPEYAEAQLNLGILFDLYLQQPAQAVPHYQRFQALTAKPDKQVALWITALNKKSPSTQQSLHP